MKTKFYLTIIALLVLFCIACDSGNYDKNTTTGETIMPENTILQTTLNEPNNNFYIQAETRFLLSALPAEYGEIKYAEMIIDDPDYTYEIPFFDFPLDASHPDKDKLSSLVAMFDPVSFGIKNVVIKIYDGESYSNKGNVIATINDTIQFNISKFYMFAGVRTNLMNKNLLLENEVSVLTNIRGDWDECWVYQIRVPKDSKVIFSHTVDAVNDNAPEFGGAVLDVHYRLDDYKYRNDLYIAPDEALYHIDTERDKWIEGSLELTEGSYTVYVAPSLPCDKSFLQVYHNVIAGSSVQGTIPESGVVTGYIKSINFERLRLLP